MEVIGAARHVYLRISLHPGTSKILFYATIRTKLAANISDKYYTKH